MDVHSVSGTVSGGGDTAVGERILTRMKQRTEKIAQRSEQRRNQQINRNTELETADAFLASFNEMKLKLEQDLVKSDELVDDRDKMMDHFNKMVRDHGYIQQYLNESNMFLAPFQIKRSQDILTDLNVDIQNKMKLLQPKKRFGFNSKKNKNKEKTGVPSSSDITDISVRQEMKHSALDKLIEKNFFGFKDKSNENLVMESEEILNRQLNLQNLSHCTVTVLGNPGAIQAASLDNCTVIIGPTSRSAFVKDCNNCRFVIACQQVRIHDTSDTDFYVHVTAAAIIESCRNVGFAPYNLDYPDIEEHYASSGLDKNINYWDKVEDFKWISKNEKSPNMHLIEEIDRQGKWLDA